MLQQLLYVSTLSNVSDIVLWLLLSAAAVAMLVLLFMQMKKSGELKYELLQLSKVKKHNVEYEFVLKAMRLSTYHIEAQTRRLTYDNDYRDKPDSYVPQPDATLEEAFSVMLEPYKSRIAQLFNDICAGKIEELHFQFQAQTRHSQQPYWAETHATVATRDVNGLPLTIVGTTLRIDEQKALENQLRDARNRAEESDRLKSAFLANTSHEIRTPLNAIVGFTSVLPDIEDDVERKAMIELIQENSQKLLRIIDDMVNISKVEASKEGVVLSQFDINELLQSYVERYQPKVKTGVELTTQYALPQLFVTSDHDRLSEIVNHLLSNAVKFTSAGNIVVGYDAPSDDQRLRLWVQDTGKGIATELQERVFERFYKVDEFVPGAGLGLSICRTMAHSLGGNVGCESSPGEGSYFWAEIPIVNPKA